MVYFEICNIFAEKFQEMTKIIGIGNALLDVIVPIGTDELLIKAGLPKGSMQLIDNATRLRLQDMLSSCSSTESAGGSASNAMQALSHLGGQAGFVGAVGDDHNGELFRKCCHESGLEVRLMKMDEATGIATTLVSSDGERTFGTFLGAASLLSPSYITENLFQGYDYLFVEGYLVQEYELIEAVMRRARQSGLKIILDLASYNVVCDHYDFFHHLVDEYVDIVFANEEECAAFTLVSNPEEGLEILSEHCDLAIVKMGAQGALARYRAGDVFFAEALQGCSVVDTTGAGDYFAGGFLYALLQGAGLTKCLQAGSLLGGTVISYLGASLPEEKWVEIRLKMKDILKGRV